MRAVGLLVLAALAVGCAKTPAVPDISGRAFFLGARELTVVEGGRVNVRSWPEGVSDVALAPTGSWLAGIAGEGKDTYVAFIPERDLRPKRLFAAPRGTPLAWSPDGKLLAVVEPAKITVWSEQSVNSATYDLPRGGAHAAVWSPDGRYLAVEAGAGNIDGYSLWLVDVENGQVAKIAEPGWNPAWHPTQPRLLYAAPGGKEGSDRLMVLDIGQAPRVFLDQEALTRAKPELAPLWEANRIAIYHISWAPHGKVFGFNFKAAGRDPRYVTVLGAYDGSVMAARIYPVHPDLQPNMSPPLPCSPGALLWTAEDWGILTRMANPGCEGQLERLHPSKLTSVSDPVKVASQSRLALSPDGKWALLHGGTGPVEIFRSNEPANRTQLTVAGNFLGWVR